MERIGRWLREIRGAREGWRFAASLPTVELSGDREPGRLETYFDNHTEGPGIWKWRHYFPVYGQYFERFVGQDVRLVEIGIFSGGSLGMWREHLGPGCHVYGVDIDPACRAYEGEGVRVFIGDQADPEFWRDFLLEVPSPDIVIDDGGHEAHQQINTFEALFPRISPGGLYVCEDVHGPDHGFHVYLDGFARGLNVPDESPIHQHVAAIHRYPNLVVIEKPSAPVRLESVRRGTQWHPDY